MSTNANERDAAKHAPLPWEVVMVHGVALGVGTRMKSSTRANVFRMIGNTLMEDSSDDDGDLIQANADFIVEACNSHYDLRAKLTAAEARAAELERQLADERSLIALKQADIDSLSRAFADERRAREAAEETGKDYAAYIESCHEVHEADCNTQNTLRERGEALARAVEVAAETLDHLLKLLGAHDVPCGEMEDILMSQACNTLANAFKAWREIAPAKPEETQDSVQ
jgi:chromosome segregation ATPase